LKRTVLRAGNGLLLIMETDEGSFTWGTGKGPRLGMGHLQLAGKEGKGKGGEKTMYTDVR